ncbi:MAG: hypothetical protein WBG65_10075 [Sulfurimonadaceae bacterium]
MKVYFLLAADERKPSVSWIDKDRLMVVSDAKKSSQPKACKKKEPSIHIVSLP